MVDGVFSDKIEWSKSCLKWSIYKENSLGYNFWKIILRIFKEKY